MHPTVTSVFDAPKIDSHCHILDPAKFAYSPRSKYHPAGQEIGTAAQLAQVFETYGIRHALLVQPNSGYGEDNRCMLAAIAASAGKYKGVAVVHNDISLEELARLKSQGIVGVAFNLTFHGFDFYRETNALLEKLVELDMYLQIQVEDQQLLSLIPLLLDSPVRILVDHCGRPTLSKGLDQPGFAALLQLGQSGRASIKLSGHMKFSQQPYPHQDAWPYIHALADAFTLDNCMWASDWPFLRATQHYDYGPLLMQVAMLFPDPADRRKLFWDTPRRLFGFDS